MFLGKDLRPFPSHSDEDFLVREPACPPDLVARGAEGPELCVRLPFFFGVDVIWL